MNQASEIRTKRDVKVGDSIVCRIITYSMEAGREEKWIPATCGIAPDELRVIGAMFADHSRRMIQSIHWQLP